MTARVAAVLLATTIGCAAPMRGGAFAPDAFYATRDHYRVGYIEHGARGHVLGPLWRLDNFRNDGGRTVARIGPDYQRLAGLDADDDDRVDVRVTFERFDLKLVHERDGSVLWSQTTPLDNDLRRRDLEVLARDYVDRVGGGSYFTIDWSAGALRERRVGTRIVREGPVTVDGVEGYEVTFDIVSIDQQTVDAEHVGERVTLILARPQAPWTPTPQPYQPGARGGAGTWAQLVIFGLASRHEHHDQHREAFEDFLGRVDFHESTLD